MTFLRISEALNYNQLLLAQFTEASSALKLFNGKLSSICASSDFDIILMTKYLLFIQSFTKFRTGEHCWLNTCLRTWFNSTSIVLYRYTLDTINCWHSIDGKEKKEKILFWRQFWRERKKYPIKLGAKWNVSKDKPPRYAFVSKFATGFDDLMHMIIDYTVRINVCDIFIGMCLCRSIWGCCLNDIRKILLTPLNLTEIRLKFG